MVLLAAEECADAERPFGKLKAILKDWSERKVRTVEEAQKALTERQKAFQQADGRRKARSRNTLLNYAETDPARVKVEEITLDLDEL